MAMSWLWLVAVAAVLLAVSGCTVWRLGEARELARQSQPYQHQPADAVLRLLIVGDSTGEGTGASRPEASLAGLLAAAYPRLAISNRARDGARFEQVARQLADADQAAADPVTRDARRADVVLILAGGNDVIRLRGEAALRADIERTLALAAQQARHVVVMPAGNVGNAPFFFPPLSWWMTARAQTLHTLVREAAARHGADYVRLYEDRADDPFVQDPSLNARDGLHPSDTGYALWFRELMAQSSLSRRLAPAAAALPALPAATAAQPEPQR
jgi:lysophospholipase L1-like esterase